MPNPSLSRLALHCAVGIAIFGRSAMCSSSFMIKISTDIEVGRI
jgi:hypothetical protein